MRALSNPSYKSAAKPATSTKYFNAEADASAYHEEMRAAGRKPRTTPCVDYRDANGRPVYVYKVTTHA